VRYGELASPASRRINFYRIHGSSAQATAGGDLLVRDATGEFTIANPDFNVLSFRSNVVLRWEWPGSVVYAVWQQDRVDDVVSAERIGVRDLIDSLRAPGNDVFVVKASFWIAAR
jgi:hypothetical protein